MTIEGVLPVWKPAGWTSHDVVAKARRLLRVKRIGHTGTLDPAVTGVLPLCVGRATRFVEYLQELPKEYEAELTIGYSTDTEDATGTVIEQVEKVALDREKAERTIASFVGVIEQIPPMYSAVKVDGKRLYELARQGVEVERKARTVEIYAIRILEIDTTPDHPVIRFRAVCSKGTYIRTLCTDIGRRLGYPAVMSSLVRTSTGGIELDQCVTLEQIETLAAENRLGDIMLEPDRLLTQMPAVSLTDSEAEHAVQGRTFVPAKPMGSSDADSGPGGQADELLVRAYGPTGRFIGIFRRSDPVGKLSPVKVFH